MSGWVYVSGLITLETGITSGTGYDYEIDEVIDINLTALLPDI